MSARVGIADLKAHLSEYLKRVRAGERILVCDRKTAIAELRPLSADLPIRPATHPPSDVLKLKGVPARAPVDVVALLREDRDQRWIAARLLGFEVIGVDL
ncbi:MAG: type II toxin-antitoxin system prevent-host-death family antitoxin [Dehalococcoidia bacterium]